MPRKLPLLVVLTALLALPATSEAASTSSQLKSLRKAVSKLQKDLKVVSTRQKATQAQLDQLVSCLVTVPIAQYGSDTDPLAPGYLFGVDYLTSFPTTGIDVDLVNPDAFLMVGLDCSAPRVARGFYRATLPRGVR
jgi:hypothetical protein